MSCLQDVLFLKILSFGKRQSTKAVWAVCSIDSVNWPLAKFPHRDRQHAFDPPCMGIRKWITWTCFGWFSAWKLISKGLKWTYSLSISTQKSINENTLWQFKDRVLRKNKIRIIAKNLKRHIEHNNLWLEVEISLTVAAWIYIWETLAYKENFHVWGVFFFNMLT